MNLFFKYTKSNQIGNFYRMGNLRFMDAAPKTGQFDWRIENIWNSNK